MPSSPLPSRATMLRQMLDRDASADGRFVTGVLTTGIYCVPSCPARKPKPENVVLFATPDAARRSGLRARLRCRPDDVVAGRDPGRDRLRAALDVLAADPLALPDVASLAEHIGVGQTTLHRLAQRVEAATPATLIHRGRIKAAMRMLRAGEAGATDAAFAVGYASVSAFYARFKEHTGTTPAAWRDARRDDGPAT